MRKIAVRQKKNKRILFKFKEIERDFKRGIYESNELWRLMGNER